MEDVNSSLDKIKAIELSFEDLSDSMNASGAIPKKRRLSQSFEGNPMNLSNNNGNVYANFAADIPPSPWETRRLKADLIEPPTRITKFKHEMERPNKLKEVTETLNENRISERDFSSNACLERLRSNNKPLQELLGHKLPLEEQVYDLCTRLDREEGGHSEAVALQVQLNHAQEEIKEWMKVAQDHSQANMLVSPLALRARIEELLQHDVRMMSETKFMESDLMAHKQKCEIYGKNIDELNAALKRHKAYEEHVQKKLLLVSKECDCYKQLLVNFEKRDLTISNPMAETNPSFAENQLKARIEMLETNLVGYKDMCGCLERALNGNQTMANCICNRNMQSNDDYDHSKKELDNLRIENERLRRPKKEELELELELEHRCLKDNLIEKLQSEIEHLNRRNKKLKDDNEVTHARLNETTNMTVNSKEINQLRSEMESMTCKLKKMDEYYKSARLEFRELVCTLFGHRIDRVCTNTNYKITSMYAESPDQYFNFRLNDSDMLDMLETAYSITLESLIESQLLRKSSFLTHLSALKLFAKVTVFIGSNHL